MDSLLHVPRPADVEMADSIILPPRPALLMALQREMYKDEPDLARVEKLVQRDAAITGHLLQTANSPFFRTTQRVRTIREALMRIGLNQCAAIMTGVLTKKAMSGTAMMMARFWDVSEKRAKGLSFMARELGTIAPDVAYNFGLFCDIGIPLLRGQLNAYQETLSAANRTAAGRFLQIEEKRHGINHASVGALLAERWEISAHITQAIQAHHNPEILRQQAFLSPSIRSLVASNLLVEKAIEQYRGEKTSLEWRVGGPFAAAALGMTEADIKEYTARLVYQFSRQE